ncbi:MAG: V-type ATP synthase subunit D [Phycisphaerae bacterium]|nr:V-type ATP synthase subunit D [Phycisphaerae bacterium]NIP52572.1 V-type ATP synthase subunit D [Phycisphaerae bacterium]NIS51556.1 V-type ATP synthase subunit D [Phycisphaerae bacterium]NIU09138.1 V-type ATP synthase subunit D [Phycisphaerae bacterium]NIU59638.1 V-type ATP synthase subunit D [Phycisphaerae bacterium]
MLANVNATRMQLLYLRKRVALARRGHRLLSEKRDEISRQLIRIARQIRPLRKKVETELSQTFRRFMLARATMEPEDIKAALEVPTKKFSLAIELASVMNVKVPHLTKEMEGEIICYGYATTSGELDVALLALERAFDSLIELAEKEKQARLLATELQMTRRRVNVLEHVVIPELDETIRFIFDKLAEAERDNTSRLMKITDIIRA